MIIIIKMLCYARSSLHFMLGKLLLQVAKFKNEKKKNRYVFTGK